MAVRKKGFEPSELGQVTQIGDSAAMRRTVAPKVYNQQNKTPHRSKILGRPISQDRYGRFRRLRQTPTPSPPISETDFRYPNLRAGFCFSSVRAGKKRSLRRAMGFAGNLWSQCQKNSSFFYKVGVVISLDSRY